MSDVVGPFLWLIPGLPLAAAAVTAFFGPKVLRGWSHWPCILATAASCVLSVVVLRAVYVAPGEEPHRLSTGYTIFRVGEQPGGDLERPAVNVAFSLRADALSAMMATMVTFIGAFIAIYSIGYMHGELNGGHGHGHGNDGHGAPAGPNYGYPRFFAEVSLFIFAMTLLVLADNLLVLYAGWEGVGLCSYLLIGFWFTRPAAANAARKAFLVTRIGDVGLFLGFLLLWFSAARQGSHWSLRLDDIFRHVHPDCVTLACLLLLCGAMGKSAQFPLHVWLPDAMEGPTPVSALIHAATMVTAGVYLIARFTPLYLMAPAAQVVVACVGCFTALFAALIALTQNDLKRVLAYSTLSQLGYMFLALGAGVGGAEKTTAAATAAMFHLFTHAFFKALLFLAAGSVMHAMANVIDMRRFSGLRKVMPLTHWTFLIGALALAGIPPLSGFWSKDDILGRVLDAGQNPTYGRLYITLFVVGLLTAGLTGFYTFRAYFKTFWGEAHVPEETGGYAEESPHVMTYPLVALAFFAVVVGAALGPTGLFEGFLGRTPGFREGPAEAWTATRLLLMAVSTLVAAAGVGVAWWMYVRKPELPAKLARAAEPLYQLSLNKFHVDELYAAFLLRPLGWLTQGLRLFDQYVVDALVDLAGKVPVLLGNLYRPVQNGLVQYYALAMVLGLTVFLLALIYYLPL
jgi:NADH-quinone oxidoreductase subunit L